MQILAKKQKTVEGKHKCHVMVFINIQKVNLGSKRIVIYTCIKNRFSYLYRIKKYSRKAYI